MLVSALVPPKIMCLWRDATLYSYTKEQLSMLNSKEFLLRGVSEDYSKLVSPAGVEPATYALGGRRAIQLCHGDSYSSIPQAR